MTELFRAVLGTGLRAVPALLLIFAARLALRKAPAVLWRPLWWGAFFRLACPVLLPVPIPAPGPGTTTLAGRVVLGTAEALLPSESPAPLPLPETPAALSLSAEKLLAAVWLAGVAAMLLRELAAWLRFRRCLVGAVRLRGNIWLGDDVPAPVTAGLLRPRIYLPSTLTGREQDCVLLHERCHIRWGDHLFKPLAALLLALHWFDPLAWLAFAWACRDLEAACDQGALDRAGGDLRQEYASAILRFAVGRRAAPAGPLSFGAGDAKVRIRRVMAYRKAPRRRAAPAGLAAVAALLLAVLTPAPYVYAAEKPLSFTPYDTFAFALRPGEVEVYGDTVTLTGTADLCYTATWSPTGLWAEVVLGTEEGISTGTGAAWLAEGRGGTLSGVFEDVPPGEYRVIVRGSRRNSEYAPTAGGEPPEITGALAFGWQEGGAWRQADIPAGGTVTFPAYREGREDYNAAVYDTTPFRVSLTLPEGWSVRMPPAEQRRTSHVFTPLWLCQGEEYAGSIGFNTFEVYPDVPPESFYRMVYNQLMLGSVVNWDNDYTVVSQWDSGCSATVQLMERQGGGGADAPVSMRPGVLACDRDRLVYVAIDLQEGRLSRQEVWALAEGLRFYPAGEDAADK